MAECQLPPSHHNLQDMRESVHQLIPGTALAIQPVALEAMGSACWGESELCRDMLQDSPALDRLELLMESILALQPVGVIQAMEVYMVAPKVLQVVTQPPLLPHSPELSSALASTMPSFASPQPSSLSVSSKAMTQPST